MQHAAQDLTTLTDEALLQLAAHDNKQALLALFDRHAAGLYAYILPLVHGIIFKTQKPADTAQAVITGVFTRLWDQRQTIQVVTTVRAYLFLEAYTAALEYGHAKGQEVNPKDSLRRSQESEARSTSKEREARSKK